MDHLCGWEHARIGQAGHVVDAVPMLAVTHLRHVRVERARIDV